MARDDSRQFLRIKVEGYLNLVRIHRELEARAAQLLENEGVYDMTLAQATALLILVQEKAPITAARLSALLNVSPVTVGRFVRSLEQNNWIRRRPDPNDARCMLLEPTRKTKRGLERFFQVADQLVDEAYAGFAKRDVEQLVRHLDKTRRNLYAAAGKPDARLEVTL